MARKGNWDPGRKRGRTRQAHFMDVAIDGYIRDVALHCWRDFEALGEAHGGDEARALEETGVFIEMGPYRPLWQSAWRKHVWPGAQPRTEHLFGCMEAAVREALLAEKIQRAEQGDVTIEDTPGYKEFVARAMNQLLEEASGEIEEMV
jgi:hypothetical protein